ncbi:glycosyltransferase family 2 protein [Microbacterium profundi]|uniref:Glycosyltransferase family 2 protein n=1 Tax=Microbacterium profundi TaxID=450380 RepID=A0ABV3LPK8_9MICO
MSITQQALSVIIVTYNSASVVEAAILGLPSDCEIIVVDNASTDSTLDILQAAPRDLTILPRSDNAGFAKAVNQGAKQATGDYLLLLNPDARIDESAVASVLDHLAHNPEMGIASPLVVEGDGALKTLAAGHEPTIWRMLTHATGLSRLSSGSDILRGHYLLRGQLGDQPERDVSWVSGGCMFVRRQAWEQLGGLTERWFMYAEDVEFCLRAKAAGFGVRVIVSAKAYHAVGMSSVSTDSYQAPRTVWLENLFDLYRLRYQAGPVRSFAWRSVVGLGFAARALVATLKASVSGHHSSHDSRRFHAYAAAMLRPKAVSRG